MSRADPDTRSGRRQLLFVASIFLVPVAAAVALYLSSAWRPAASAHGELIDPPRPLSTAGAVLPDGQPAPAEVFQGRWSLVHAADAACGERTRALVDELARVSIALDKDAPRTKRVLLHGGECSSMAFGSGDADLLVLAADGPAGNAFRAQFPPAVDGSPGIYIVDPHGNLMMSYPASGSARGLLKDLERLLRLSNIG